MSRINKFILLLLAILGFKVEPVPVKKSEPNTHVEVSNNNFPYLNLPLEYFPKSSIVWGSVYGDNYDKYKHASFDIDSYQSYPTETVAIKEYKNEKRPLNPPKTLESLSDQLAFGPTIRKNFKEYGILSTRYLPEDYIHTKNEFDVDADGKSETIVSLGGTGGNHPPLYSEIIKDGYVIFSVQETQPIIIPSKTNNGFYVQWYNFDKHFEDGMCCPSGHIKTRFVYKDGKFTPIWEQEVIYTKVGNPDEE